MAANQQIGWSQEAILLRGISKELERLAGILASSGGSGGSVPSTRTITINGVTQSLATDLVYTIPVPVPPLEYSTVNNTVWNNGKSNISSNTSFGDGALVAITNGVENTAYGFQALSANTGGTGNQGSYNTGVGWGALMLNTTGDDNTAVGDSCSQNGTTANFNTAIGASALFKNVFGSQIVAIGASALTNNIGTSGSNVLGHRSVAIGSAAMFSNTTGNGVAIGDHVLYSQTTGQWNICLGPQAGSGITTGFNNVIVAGTGFVTLGGGITTGSNNMILAPNDGNTTGITTGSGNIVIGKVTGLPATATNTITIADGTGNIRQTFDVNGLAKLSNYGTASAPTSGAIPLFPLSVDTNGNIVQAPTRRVAFFSGVTSMTPNVDGVDIYKAASPYISGATYTFNAPTMPVTSTRRQGQELLLDIRDNGTAVALVFPTAAVGDYASTVQFTLPTTTIAGKWIKLFFMWNDDTTVKRWELIRIVNSL